MNIGMIGLGRMGANMAQRLMQAGHHCVGYDLHTGSAQRFADQGGTTVATMAALIAALPAPRALWMMVPVAAVDATIDELLPLLEADDVLVDGGNSHYRDAIRRARDLGRRGIHSLDVGTSGGIWGREQGYCLMIGGQSAAVQRLQPLFAALAPGVAAAPRTAGRSGELAPAELGYLHCGPSGAGHFVKMIHNGIEYGMMAALAEGLNILQHANAGALDRSVDAETAPLADPAAYRYDFDLAAITELWRRGSVVRSWLLDLGAHALLEDPQLGGFEGRVSDSGEGRWTLMAAIDSSVPAPVLSAALFERFASRGEGEFAAKLLSALRNEFGGHSEKPRGGAS